MPLITSLPDPASRASDGGMIAVAGGETRSFLSPVAARCAVHTVAEVAEATAVSDWLCLQNTSFCICPISKEQPVSVVYTLPIVATAGQVTVLDIVLMN